MYSVSGSFIGKTVKIIFKNKHFLGVGPYKIQTVIPKIN